MAKNVALREQLKDYMAQLPVIDMHEHFVTEEEHLQTRFTFFHLFIPYVQFDFYAAGMPKEWLWRAPQSDAELEQYWKTLAPLWPAVKHGSYAKVTRLMLKEFWDVDDITDANFKEIGGLLDASNRPGLFEEVFLRKCNIKTILNQNANRPNYQAPYMKGSYNHAHNLDPAKVRAFIETQGDTVTLDDYVNHIIAEIDAAHRAGAVLSKFCVSFAFYEPPDRNAANEEFARFRREPEFKSPTRIQPYIADRLLDHLGKIGMNAAVHTGVWDDINMRNPERLFPVIAKHPDVTFDVYHMGIPYVHECGFLAKNFPNAYLDLCWSHIVAPQMVIRALDEYLDYVPTSKVFAFGGDYITNPQNVWAHLQIAFDNLAEVFARRIQRNVMDLDDAKQILRAWFYETPRRVYRLTSCYT